MAHRGDIPLDGDNAIKLFEKRKADKAARAAVKGKVPTLHLPSSTFKRHKKIIVEDTSPDWTSEDILIKFPSSASSYSEFGPHYDEASKLLWPTDEARFKEHGLVPSGRSGVHHAFQSMQVLMHLTKEVGELEAQPAFSASDRVKLHEENMALLSQKKEMSRMIMELQNQLKDFLSDADQLRSAHSEIESLQTELADAEDRICIAALRAEIKLKAKMMEEFEKGLAHTWDAARAFAARDKLEQLEREDPTDDIEGGPTIDLSQLHSDMTTGEPFLESGRTEQVD